jgi:transcription initiation factor IIE alpha subunit
MSYGKSSERVVSAVRKRHSVSLDKEIKLKVMRKQRMIQDILTFLSNLRITIISHVEV